jgi:hypothetical protein
MNPELTADELRAETERAAGRDLTAMIAQLRAGGVLHAEFHPDGRVKVLTLGPEVTGQPTTTEDDEPGGESAFRSQMRAAAATVSFKKAKLHD